MTFEQVLVKYFYQHKKISLEGIGTVTLDGMIPDDDFIHKNRLIPVDGLHFEYNLKADVDDGFATFYAQQSGKIKPLALSDIESHLQLARQLMNIGNPYEITGLGTFTKQNDGSVKLQPGYYVTSSGDAPQPMRLKERAETTLKKELHEAPLKQKSGGGAVKWILGVVIILALGAGGWYVWSNFLNKQAPAEIPPVVKDTTQNQIADTSSQLTSPALNNMNSEPQWKAYFRYITGKEEALSKFKMYKGNKNPVTMETTDSVNFSMYVIMQSAVADTARKADSLRKFYARPIKLEKINP